MRISRIVTAAVLAFATIAYTYAQAAVDPTTAFADKPLNISIVETTDLHGSIFPYNFITAKPAAASLAQVATYVGLLRKDTTRETILLDNGDSLQGQPPVYYYNFVKTADI